MTPDQDDRGGVGGGAATIIVSGAGVLLGLAIGVSGPVFLVGIGVGLVVGPTWGGLAALLGILVAIVSGFVGLIVLAFGRRASLFGSAFVVSLAFVVSIFGGNGLGRATGVAGWAVRPSAEPLPTLSFGPIAPSFQANGELTIHLDDPTGFVAPSLEPFGDGTFGHWCYSEPGVKRVARIEAITVGSFRGGILRAEIHLRESSSIAAAMSLPIPRVAVTVADERGVVLGLWSGPLTMLESGSMSGRLAFTDLPLDEGYRSPGLPETLSGEFAWRCGAWQQL